METDIRWKQRFQNYKKALSELKNAVELKANRSLSNLERSGFIRSFEFTQELSWKVLKDFIENEGGGEKIYGSKSAVRQAFNRGLISDGEIWIDMIDSRNESSHLYDESTALKIFGKIESLYLPCFTALEEKFDELAEKES